MASISPPSESSSDAALNSAVDAHAVWAAVVQRDRRYDGRFVFAVVTTGVYCRPGCASRRPRPENVRFFDTPAQAEASGFRPCKRCRPGEHRPSSAERSVESARAYLDAHLDENTTLERLARVAHLSAWHLQRVFKRQVGLTPRQYVELRRAERLKARLRSGDTVSRAAFEAGYASPGRVYEQTDTHLGMTPGVYRKGGHGIKIGFVTTATSLGSLLVAATDRGVCSVRFGDDAGELEAALRSEYPRAVVVPAASELQASVEAIAAFAEGATRDLATIPLDVPASRFQWRVWQALREIPYGGTVSYRQVAEAIGQPSAARAVARACATNPVALVIPCHRVIRGDGSVSGYRWGEDRKRRLLNLEATAAAD